jgi:hypothetical protein
MVVIDAHLHLLQGRHASGDRPRSLDELVDVDVAQLVTGLDQLGVQAVVSLAQEMTRVRDQWLGSNELAVDRRVAGDHGVWTECMLLDATYDRGLTLPTRFALSDRVRRRRRGAG